MLARLATLLSRSLSDVTELCSIRRQSLCVILLFTESFRLEYVLRFLSLGRFQELFRKDWVLAILIILLAVETAILIMIAVEWSLGNQNFPPVSIIPPLQLQCTTLTSRVV